MAQAKKQQAAIPPLRFSDGTVLGERIPGSRFVRSICDGCSELIRVTQASTRDYCETCDPRSATVRVPRVAPTREMADKKHFMMAAMAD